MTSRTVRFTCPGARLPVCGGWSTQPHKQGKRCYGFRTEDGRFTYCTRPEYAGAAPFKDSANAYQHFIYSECRCGSTHGYGTPPPVLPRAERRRMDDEAASSRSTLDTRNAVYTRYLGMLTFRQNTSSMSGERGEADLQAAIVFGYRSLPVGYNETERVVSTLVQELSDTHFRSPGFYRTGVPARSRPTPPPLPTTPS